MNDEFSFWFFTDPHFYDLEIPETQSGEFQEHCRQDQKCVLQSSAIMDKLCKNICAESEPSVVLIAGDLTHWGERACHKAFRERLKKLKENGKQVYLITATHDYGRSFKGETSREELAEFYWDYGFSQAISTYSRDGLSYVAQLAPGVRLLALNSDGNTKDFRGLWDDQLEWAKEQIADAHESGNYIFAIMHYPLLPGSPVMGMVRDATVADWKKTASFLADAGLDLIFTGHMHMQSLNTFTSAAGNKITDVCTGATCACPPAYRKVKFTENGKADIRSFIIKEIDYNTDGKTLEKFADDQFCKMINRKIDQMATDYQGFMRYLSNKEPNPKLERPITFAGRTIQKLTVGKFAKLFMIKAAPSIKDILFKDFLMGCVLNIFKGDEPYIKGTAEYELFRKLFSRLRLPIDILEKKLAKKDPIFADIPAFVFSLIGDENQLDNNAIIDIDYNKYAK